jgi:hypothetical protein
MCSKVHDVADRGRCHSRMCNFVYLCYTSGEAMHFEARPSVSTRLQYLDNLLMRQRAEIINWRVRVQSTGRFAVVGHPDRATTGTISR